MNKYTISNILSKNEEPHTTDTIRTEIDSATGEVLYSKVQTAAQKDGYQKHLKNQAIKEVRGAALNKQAQTLGGFVWFLYNVNEALSLGISPAELSKIIFLATFLNYDGYIGDYHGNRFTSDLLGSLLKISRASFFRFFSDVKKSGILIEEPGTHFVKFNDQVFKKGALGELKPNENAVRLYANAIREMYRNADISEHKTLSYVFQAIPFINFQYNIICSNPYETELKKVKRLLFPDYCDLINYSKNNHRRLFNAMRKLTVDSEYVFGFTQTGDDVSIFINPRIYYAGTCYDQVRILGKFFRGGDDD